MVHRLVELLADDPDAGVRWRAVEALRGVHADGAIVSGALRKALHDTSYYVRLHARLMLREATCDDATHALTDALASQDPAVRGDAAEEVGANAFGAPFILERLASMVAGDAVQTVRRQAATALAATPRLVLDAVPLLERSLADDDAIVRVYSAIALARLGTTGQPALETLIAELDDRVLAGPAWSGICLMCERGDRTLRASGGLAARFQQETLARGVLPTVGMKIWNPPLPVTIPSRATQTTPEHPYVWTDLGVFHSGQTHALWNNGENLTLHQVCIAVDWFPGVYMIALSQMISHEANWNAWPAPVQLEGRELGLVIQGGYVLARLEGMRPIDQGSRTNRLDFVHGTEKDVRVIQYLTFAGVSAQKPKLLRTSLECLVSKIWSNFHKEFGALLAHYSLAELTGDEAFAVPGWRSIRYGRRYECPYSELAGNLVKLSTILASKHGDALRERTYRLCSSIAEQIASLVRSDGLPRIPLALSCQPENTEEVCNVKS